jgi:hypothetical protein
MPCIDEPILAKNGEIDTLIKVINGKITVKNVGNDFDGKYPTVKSIVADLRNEKAERKTKTFHYKVHGHMMIVVSPCPKGC